MPRSTPRPSPPTRLVRLAGRARLAGLVVGMLGPGLVRPALGQEVEVAPAATSPRILGHAVAGGVDPPGRLESLLAIVAPIGSYFVEAGPADRVTSTPLSTVGRLEAALERLGYTAAILVQRSSTGVFLDVRLSLGDRVRFIFVDGNWPLRQEDLIRRLTVRPGQALPAPGPARRERLERERLGVLTYLRDQGYLEAAVAIEVRRDRPTPAPVNLVLRIHLGPGYPIGPILVEGNTALDRSAISEQLRHMDWRFLWTQPLPFRLSVLREDLALLTQRYRDLGYAGARLTTDFDPQSSVDFQRRHVRLSLTVLERKRVEVTFEGHERLDEGDLREALTLFRRGSYDSFEAEASAAAIAQEYRNRGHLFVRVTWRADGSAPDVHRIRFTIREGPSLKVRQVAFAGNRAFRRGRLADVVTVRAFPLLGHLGVGEGGYASFRQLELDVERLTGFYQGSGYPDVRVRGEVAPQPERWQALGSAREQDGAWASARGLYVRFVIDEGPRVDLEQVAFLPASGESLPYPIPFLLESLDSKVGEPFRPEVVRSDGERLRRLLGDAAYPDASVDPEQQREGNRVRLTWRVRLGPQRRVGPLFVRGNFRTTERTIRRWMLLRPGDLVTTTAFERSQRNLALIQIFNNASPLSFPPELGGAGIVPMLVEVEERHDHWGVLRVGGGASTEQAVPDGFPVGAYGALGYEHRNLFGQSWLLASRAELGNTVTRVEAQFTDPRFLGSHFRLQLTGAYVGEATVRLGDIRTGGGTLGFAREMYPGIDASLTYGWRRTVRSEYLLRGAGPDAEQERVSIATTVGSLALALEWQRLDNPLVPTRGFKVQSSLELAIPALSFRVGEDTFLKAAVRALAVIPLTGRLALRHSLRYDQGFPLGGASLLPKVERFFAGGDTTLRGFDIDRARTDFVGAEIGPLTAFAIYRPLGGSLRLLHNLDLQFRITGPWFGGVFFDTGVVADSFDGLAARTFRHGAGVAPLVFKLPIGDISIAYAWPLDPQPGDPRNGRLHFNVGLMF